jgi:VPS inhibitor protein D
MPKKRHLKNQLYTLSKTDNGYVLNPPVHKGLVISGGGAKGLGYAGMVKAMYDQGFIKQLTHVAGASAGAMTGSFIATGMSPETILNIVSQLNITKFLDKKGRLTRAEGVRLRNVFTVLYVLQIKQHIKGIAEPESQEGKAHYALLNRKIKTYQRFLEQSGINIDSIDEFLNRSSSSEYLNVLDTVFSQLPKNIQNAAGEFQEPLQITFRDLARLRDLMPADQKYLIKHFSVVTTNQTRKKIEIYNEDNAQDESIAEKVQHSGAHPVLFRPAKNIHGDNITDGGIKNNMPTKALQNAGLIPEEILCVKAETHSKFAKRIHRAKTPSVESVTTFNNFIDSIIKNFLGGRLYEGRAKVINREKVFYDLGNMLYLNTGEINTTTAAPTHEQKEYALKTAYQQTHDYLIGRTQVFDNALIAMLYLGIDKLNHTLLNENAHNELLVAAHQAKQIALLQKAIIDELNSTKDRSIIDFIDQIETLLRIDSGLNETQQNQAFSLCLKQINFSSEGRLEHYIIEKINKEEESPIIRWCARILELLWQSITWVFSLCCVSKAEEPVEEHNEQNQAPKQNTSLISLLRILGFLSNTPPNYKDQLVSDEGLSEYNEIKPK